MKAPTFLTTDGKRRFSKLAKDLPELTEPQQSLLALYCQSWDDYHGAQENINTHGAVIKSGDRLFVNPACNTKAEAWKQILKLANVFGFIPEVATGTVVETSPLEKLIEGNKDVEYR